MLVAMMISPYPVSWWLMSLLLFVPVNVLIFGLENVIFLLFPYRHNQEGVNVFLRSILTFTAKGLLFLVAAIVTGLWARTARGLVNQLGGDPMAGMRWVFSLGMWAILSATGVTLVMLIARVYQQFDPSQDTPPIS